MKSDVSLKVAIVSGAHFDQKKGGSEYQLLLLGKHLAQKSHSVYYIYRHKAKIINSSHGIINLTYRYSKFKAILFGNAFFPYVFQVWRLLYRIKPQIIIVRPGNALVGLCALYCKLANIKMIWHIAGKYDVEKFKWFFQLRVLTELIERKILDFGINNASFIIGQANYQNLLLQKNFKRKCDVIVPNFHPIYENVAAKGFDPITVLWVANYKKNKQPEIFIQLAQDMEIFSNIRFYMIGRPDHANRLSETILQTKNLEHLGELSVDQVLNVMKRSHILINTSISEGYPNTFIQAWLNRMVVLSLHANPDNVLTDLQIGYEAGTYQRMSEILRTLITSPDIIVEKGNLAYEFAQKVHSLSNLKEYEQFIINACNATKR